MSKPVSAMAIGGFLIAGVGLLILALLLFGGNQFFKPRIEWVVFFDTSLNGLNVGAPVKVQGVQVGLVKEIGLQLDWDRQRLTKPVVLEIDPLRLTTPDGTPLELSLFSSREIREELRQLIDAGLRARLELQSILTGLLYVDLNFHPQQPARLTGLNYRGLPEVPSIPPTVDEVVTTLEDVVKRIRNMPLEAMVDDLAVTLAEVRKLVGSAEARQSSKALNQAVTEARQLLQSFNRRVPGLLKQMDETLGNMNQTSRDIGATARATTSLVGEARTHVVPVMKAAEQTLLKATEALESTRTAAAGIADATGEGSTLLQSVVELRRAARSLRDLTDYLERHPESVVFGKPD
jgi:paraquat-inducible protein B